MKVSSPVFIVVAGLLSQGVPPLNASEHIGGVEHHADTATSVAVPLPGVLDTGDPNDLLIRQTKAATLRIPYVGIRFYNLSPPVRPAKGDISNVLTLGYQDPDGTAHSLVLQLPANRARTSVRDLEEQTGFKAGSEPMPFAPLPGGASVACRLEQSLSSARDDAGKPVQLSVIEDVKVDGRVVIPQGSRVSGTIVQSEGTWRTGKTGKLDFSIDEVEAMDGEYLPLRYSAFAENGAPAVRAGVYTAGAGVLFWPEAPFLLVRQGKDVEIPKGVVIAAFLAGRGVPPAQPTFSHRTRR